MCGLSGYIGSSKADPYALRVLLLDNEIRGDHATGMANLEGKVDKWAIDPQSYMMYSEFNELAESSMVLLHNRYSTMTNTNDHEAAHPFKFDNGRIIGAHNGFLINWKHQAKRLKIKEKRVTVDSELFYIHLVNNKYDTDCFKDIEGACSLSWIDTKTKTFYLYRRSSRPLFIGEVNKGELYYSSRENGLNLLGCRGTVELEEDIVYGFQNGELVSMKHVPPPTIALPMDTTTSMLDYHMNDDDYKYTGMAKPATKYTPGRIYGVGTASNARNYHSRFYDPYSEFEDDYEVWRGGPITDHRAKKSKEVSVSEVLGGRLEKLVTLSIDNFPPKRQDLVGAEIKDLDNKDKSLSQIVASITSSINGMPVPDAIVFAANSCDPSTKFFTTNEGVASLPLDAGHLGKFIRVIVMPFPYNKMYYSRVLEIKEGEIVEVSLSVPFLESDRHTLNKLETKIFSKYPSIKLKLYNDSTGVSEEDEDAPAKYGYTQEDQDELIGELQSKLDELGWSKFYATISWDEEVEEDTANEESTDFEHEPAGYVPGFGVLNKHIYGDSVEICDDEFGKIIDIEAETYKSYAFEFYELQSLGMGLVDWHTDTSYAYFRYCGESIYEVIKKHVHIFDSTVYMQISDIEREAIKHLK
jgi:hypothetical protein